jgi:hypothetical protein
MRCWMLGMLAFSCTGCTMMSLERHTIGQSDSATDIRYRQVLHNLSLIADDPSALPSYSSIYSGTVFVQDQGQIVSTNILPYLAAAKGSIAANPSLNRQISQNWFLDPIASPEKLEAIRACCQWAVHGPEQVNPDSRALLIRPDQAPAGPDRHFSVEERLAKLPSGWLGRGRFQDVPKCAAYKAHVGDTWVWVRPEDMAGLTAFALIIQDIARVGINSPTLFNLPPLYNPITFETADKGDDVRKKITVQAYVDQSGQLTTSLPYYPLRVDNLGSDNANLRSAIGAAGISSVPH